MSNFNGFRVLAALLHGSQVVGVKFALRPHHVWKYGRHPTAEIRRGKKRKKMKERINNRMKI